MAFGYYSPQYNGYQTPYAQPMVQPIAPPTPQPVAQAQNNGLVWVQGEAGAKSFLMAPNTTALLMDSESSKMYIKSTDASGMPSMRIFEYNEVNPQAPIPQNSTEYVTKAEFEEFRSRMEDLAAKAEKKPRTAKTEVVE